ncbi:hypothetical protein K456DRAFT_1766582 [Colletotrichum gloeosporioides 23]|nr:hypothetical protein K456DRAFT_1766582 [Colletotrichum gloeosporioides 23]
MAQLVMFSCMHLVYLQMEGFWVALVGLPLVVSAFNPSRTHTFVDAVTALRFWKTDVFVFSRAHPPLVMPVEETLDKLDPPAASAEETPRHLWDALEAGFRQNANLKEADFSRWALSNVDRKILKNAADSRLANEIKSLRPDFPSRYANVLTAFDVSLGILLQLFGFKVVSSRACNSSFIQLCKVRPDLRIEELYDAWNTQPTVVNSRLISEITRFQRAANSVDANIASHVQRPRRKTEAKETTPAVAASIETADRKTFSRAASRDASPHTPTRDRHPPSPDLRRSFSDSPEASRQLCRVRQRETSSLDVAPSPPFKRARPLQSDPLPTASLLMSMASQMVMFSASPAIHIKFFKVVKSLLSLKQQMTADFRTHYSYVETKIVLITYWPATYARREVF